MMKEIEIELQRSLGGTHQYRNAVTREVAGGAEPSSVGASGRVLYPELSYAIVGALIEVHRWLGPGQLESTYQNALEKELGLRGIRFRAQVPIAARFKDWEVGEFFADVIVEDAIVLELKAVANVLPVHRAQLISYLHATRCRLGMLVNFHVPVMVHGIKRIAL